MCVAICTMYLIYIFNRSIVDILVSISPFGSNIVGDGYHLVCTVTVTGTTDQPTITWLDPMNNTISSGVVTTGSLSTLTFNPLAASHAGTYTCRAMLGGAVQIERMIVTVQSECSYNCYVLCSMALIVSPMLTMHDLYSAYYGKAVEEVYTKPLIFHTDYFCTYQTMQCTLHHHGCVSIQLMC